MTYIIVGIICLSIGFLVGVVYQYRPKPKIEPYPESLLRQIRESKQ